MQVISSKENLDFDYSSRKRRKRSDLLNSSLALEMLKGNFDESINLLQETQTPKENSYLKSTTNRMKSS